MKSISLSLFLVFCFSLLTAQNYDDVVVVVNDNDSSSLEIGQYFASQRGIPPSRVLHVQFGNDLEVDSLGFEAYRSQLEAALISGNLLDSVNYIVTTKGLPLRVSKNGACDSLAINCCTSAPVTGCKSVDAEISKILGPFAGDILQNQIQAPNPYYHAEVEFSRDSFGIFIMSRLDGNTVEDVKSLVDNGGSDRPFYPPQSKVMADVYGLSSSTGIGTIFAGQIPAIDTACQQIGVTFVADTDNQVFLGNQSNLIGLHTYTIDTTGIATNTCQPGALVYDGMSFSGYDFSGQSNPQNSNSAWRFVRSGAGAIVTNVSAYYSGPSSNPSLLFPFYLDTLEPWHNAGMAFYHSLGIFGQQQYLLGDPKTSLRPTSTAAIDAQGIPGDVRLFPNPSNGHVSLAGAFSKPSPVNYQWLDLQGKTLFSGTLRAANEGFLEEFDLSELPNGLYLLRLEQGGILESHRLVIQR